MIIYLRVSLGCKLQESQIQPYLKLDALIFFLALPIPKVKEG
jgi:hypothetical protein